VIRVVAFDADDTLLDFETSMWSSLSAVLPAVRSLTPAAAALTVEDLDADWDLVCTATAVSLSDVRREAFRTSLARIGVTDTEVVDEINGAYYTHRKLTTRAFPDVAAILSTLERRYQLGYATNGNSDPAHAGLDGIFAFEVYAHVDGLPPKPSPEFFDRVISRSGVPAHEIVYIGDSWANDVTGAVRAGMHAVWLNRARRARPDGQPGIAEIVSLHQLPAVVAAIR
jgi:FMN hydrolase / 5-amino-6-(5-phospho-D-ribitylamino)uracil phosphatase